MPKKKMKGMTHGRNVKGNRGLGGAKTSSSTKYTAGLKMGGKVDKMGVVKSSGKIGISAELRH